MMRRGHLMSIFVGGRLLRCAAAPACKARSAAVNDDALLPGWPLLLLPCCCGLVSRSRGLHCPSDLERVLSSMEKATIETAQVIGISELGKMGIAKRTSDVARYIVRCPGTVTGLRCEMLDIYWRDRCVTFFSAAGKDLLVAVAVPHDIPTDAETNGIKRVHTLSLLDGDVTAHVEPLHQVYEVYCAENGVDKLRSDNSSFENNLKDFVLKTLMLHQKQNLGAVTPHLALSPTYFVANRILKVDGRHRCLAAENRDWRMLTHRFIDYRHGKGQFCSDLVDLKLPQTWAIDANVAVLIGGESGSGKTMEMICGHCDKSDLVIYVRGFPGEDGVVDDIHSAFYYSSPLMEDVLKRHTSGETFTVRLCFDDIDDSPAFVSVCSMDIKKLRGKLGWGPLVEIRVTAAGSGIVAASNVSGITSNLYQLAQLTRNEPTRNAASVYWEIRRHLSNELMQARSGGRAADFDELLSDVEILEKHWGDRQQREALLRKRSATLSRLLRKLAGTTAPCSVSTPLKVTEPVHTLLMQEALFAAVESDGTCAAALANPRMAALLVNEVLEIARQTSADEISVATREVNVRRHVLQRAARGFKVISERDYTFREVTPQLVESLRHVLFDGYTSAETHCYNTHVLVAHQAILNDNVVYERDVTKGYAVVLGDDGKPRTMTIKSRASKSGVVYTACYPKDVGRYSISPAMMVILTTLMSGVFEENFTNTNNGFEHSMAKFLYLAVQVFHGRPVRELVNFVAGPSAIVGKAAQKILDSSTTINFIALTLRMGENKSQARGAEQSIQVQSIQVQSIPAPKVLVDEALAKSVASKLSPEDDPGEACVCKPLYRQDNNPEVKKCSLCAWIECSPTWLPSADVVLHIPKVVTITIQRIKTFPTKIECRNVPGSLKAMRSPAADIYNERLQKLGAPVIAILCASDDALMTGKRAGWGRADSSHCIVMANGAGANIRSNESMSEVGDATHDDNAEMNHKRLHCAKDLMMMRV